jgi:response regulator RpfG family c-di-GMP phosphodiesterase
MKKIIIARGIMHALSGTDTIFGRGNIAAYPARTSEEILNIHGVRKADLIITEASLPLMGAATLCATIRRDALLRNVSIVVICDKTEECNQWREAGANAAISRPVDTVQLFSRISELLVIPQRKELRVPLTASVKSRDKKSTFSADSRNISISGMLLETDHVLEKGDRLTCTFNIAHSELIMECLVTRADAAGPGKQQYGVTFSNCDTKSMIIIDHFIKSQAKQ